MLRKRTFSRTIALLLALLICNVPHAMADDATTVPIRTETVVPTMTLGGRPATEPASTPTPSSTPSPTTTPTGDQATKPSEAADHSEDATNEADSEPSPKGDVPADSADTPEAGATGDETPTGTPTDEHAEDGAPTEAADGSEDATDGTDSAPPSDGDAPADSAEMPEPGATENETPTDTPTDPEHAEGETPNDLPTEQPGEPDDPDPDLEPTPAPTAEPTPEPEPTLEPEPEPEPGAPSESTDVAEPEPTAAPDATDGEQAPDFIPDPTPNPASDSSHVVVVEVEPSHAPEMTAELEVLPAPETVTVLEASLVPEASPAPEVEEVEEEQTGRGDGSGLKITSNKPKAGWTGVVPAADGGMPIPRIYQSNYKTVLCYYNGTPRSVSSSGCNVTSVAMVAAYLTGEKHSPEKMFSWALKNGLYAGNGLGHAEMSRVAANYGVSGRWIGRDGDAVVAALKAGKPVIAHMGPGLFTRRGHYIVLRGVTEDGKILVNDSASSYRSGLAFPMSTILKQTRNSTPFMVCGN